MNIDPSQDPTSPYYLHPSENPSLVLVSFVLDGPNYHQWSRSFRMSLVSKNKLGFIDGTIVAPARSNILFPAWERANMMVVSWIIRSLSSSIAQSVIWRDILVVQQERQMFGDTVEQSKVMVVAGKGGRVNNGKGNNSKICSHCGKSGHTVDTCYKKHGFPPHFKFTKQNQNKNKVYVNDSVHNDDADRKEFGLLKEHLGHQQFGFTEEQYQGLIALLQQSQISNSSHVSNQVSATLGPFDHSGQIGNTSSSFSSWVLDSGATDHICYCLSHFTSYHKIKPIHVTLPNGNKVVANYSGNVFLTLDHVLHNFLYIPSFSFNLLSIGKLTASLSFILTFDFTHCQIQDKITLKTIGIANILDSLYILRVPFYQLLPYT
uniref:Uncharacterized protein n=1 Tax=Cajanus cajan TaxID=3821 RepID=A0A151TZV3_CAJCA|nr:hypothetical protein KK1_005199 [Cajanus cajan]